jgi:hypothetical protein
MSTETLRSDLTNNISRVSKLYPAAEIAIQGGVQ